MQITGTAGNDLLNGTAGADTIFGGAGTDTVMGALFSGPDGTDTMIGGSGDDTYYVDNPNDVVIEGAGGGTDTVMAMATSYVLGPNIENLIFGYWCNGTGNELNNVLSALTDLGDNILDGGAGADTMMGGAGDDTYIVDNPGDVVIEVFPIVNDPWTIASMYTDTVKASISYTLGAYVENLILTGSALTGTGNELDNVITGNAMANTLSGGSGNDTLNGGAGNDTIDGGAGADTMNGGAGDDTYIVDNAGDVVTENANEGNDTVQSSVDYTLGANVENLTLTADGLIGTGNSGANVLTANGTNDTLVGGAGDDTYVIHDLLVPVINENPGEGTDTVISDARTYTLAANVENLTMLLPAVNGTGNELDNVINGNAGDNTLDGGVGADTMIGSLGDDTYIVDNPGDVVVETWAADSFDTPNIIALTLTDTVKASIDYTLGTNVENLTLTGSALNGTGNELDNVITGNAMANTLSGGSGNDTLDGGVGNDTMIGGTGDDVYYVDSDTDVIRELAGQGHDTVYTSHFYYLPTNVETLIMTGTDDLWAVGNGAASTMYGNSGNNSLSAGTGATTMYGGLGDDVYYVNKLADVVIENPGEGFDTIFTSVSMTATDNVEALALTGTQDLSLTGGTANTLVFLYGNLGDNTLTSGGGQTIAIGQLGDDVAYVNHDNDQVVEAANQGFDTIYSSVSYTLSDYVEALHLTGTADLYAEGNAGTSFLYGNSGNNSLIAGSGLATMYGGLGDDMYTVNKAGDTVVENANEGFDTVFSSVSYTLSSNVEALVLTGSGNTSATGNGGDNFLYGNAGNNILDGGGGTDVLTGNAGADTFVLTSGGGNDIVTDFSHAQGDHVDLTSFHTTFAALAITTSGSDALVSIAGQTLTLQNVAAASLTSADFLL